MAFHVNQKRLLKEERENGAANVTYYEGNCLTCEYSPDREARAACPRADFFTVTAYISRSARAKNITHLCKNWVLCSEITSCFKKNMPSETQTAPQNSFQSKKPKYK